ncbi:MAG TPA: HD-GYP domain-containing protein [Candidatus Dormibacteraeota bacterium]|nr:HD-GYP domain-containing protein [Candidatus Dormibacteraeota bacterium]
MLHRYEFLIRFGLLALVVSVASSLVLSRVFSAQERASTISGAVYSALSRVGEDLTPIVASTDLRRPISRRVEGQLDREARQLESFDQFALNDRALRLYRTDGIAIYPLGAPPQRALAAAAMRASEGGFVTGPMHDIDGDAVFTAYSPFGNPNGNSIAAVIGIDFWQSQVDAQGAPATRFIFRATWTASILIFVSLLALAVAAQRELNRRQHLADETFTQAMTGIAAIVDKRDPYTAGHSRRVAEYAVKLAQRLTLKPSLVKTIGDAALLHDVGKIGIPDAVLLKPGSLDQRERAIMGQHPEVANAILGSIDAMRDIVPCVLHHHERWDGRGYPRKIAGEAIPLGARIIAVADTYDAMTTDRPYRRALTPDAARQELLRGAGTQWDASCVHAFVQLIDAGHVPPPPPAVNLEDLARLFGQQIVLGAESVN